MCMQCKWEECVFFQIVSAGISLPDSADDANTPLILNLSLKSENGLKIRDNIRPPRLVGEAGEIY